MSVFTQEENGLPKVVGCQRGGQRREGSTAGLSSRCFDCALRFTCHFRGAIILADENVIKDLENGALPGRELHFHVREIGEALESSLEIHGFHNLENGHAWNDLRNYASTGKLIWETGKAILKESYLRRLTDTKTAGLPA